MGTASTTIAFPEEEAASCYSAVLSDSNNNNSITKQWHPQQRQRQRGATASSSQQRAPTVSPHRRCRVTACRRHGNSISSSRSSSNSLRKRKGMPGNFRALAILLLLLLLLCTFVFPFANVCDSESCAYAWRVIFPLSQRHLGIQIVAVNSHLPVRFAAARACSLTASESATNCPISFLSAASEASAEAAAAVAAASGLPPAAVAAIRGNNRHHAVSYVSAEEVTARSIADPSVTAKTCTCTFLHQNDEIGLHSISFVESGGNNGHFNTASERSVSFEDARRYCTSQPNRYLYVIRNREQAAVLRTVLASSHSQPKGGGSGGSDQSTLTAAWVGYAAEFGVFGDGMGEVGGAAPKEVRWTHAAGGGRWDGHVAIIRSSDPATDAALAAAESLGAAPPTDNTAAPQRRPLSPPFPLSPFGSQPWVGSDDALGPDGAPTTNASNGFFFGIGGVIAGNGSYASATAPAQPGSATPLHYVAFVRNRTLSPRSPAPAGGFFASLPSNISIAASSSDNSSNINAGNSDNTAAAAAGDVSQTAVTGVFCVKYRCNDFDDCTGGRGTVPNPLAYFPNCGPCRCKKGYFGSRCESFLDRDEVTFFQSKKPMLALAAVSSCEPAYVRDYGQWRMFVGENGQMFDGWLGGSSQKESETFTYGLSNSDYFMLKPFMKGPSAEAIAPFFQYPLLRETVGAAAFPPLPAALSTFAPHPSQFTATSEIRAVQLRTVGGGGAAFLALPSPYPTFAFSPSSTVGSGMNGALPASSSSPQSSVTNNTFVATVPYWSHFARGVYCSVPKCHLSTRCPSAGGGDPTKGFQYADALGIAGTRSKGISYDFAGQLTIVDSNCSCAWLHDNDEISFIQWDVRGTSESQGGSGMTISDAVDVCSRHSTTVMAENSFVFAPRNEEQWRLLLLQGAFKGGLTAWVGLVSAAEDDTVGKRFGQWRVLGGGGDGRGRLGGGRFAHALVFNGSSSSSSPDYSSQRMLNGFGGRWAPGHDPFAVSSSRGGGTFYAKAVSAGPTTAGGAGAATNWSRLVPVNVSRSAPHFFSQQHSATNGTANGVFCVRHRCNRRDDCNGRGDIRAPAVPFFSSPLAFPSALQSGPLYHYYYPNCPPCACDSGFSGARCERYVVSARGSDEIIKYTVPLGGHRFGPSKTARNPSHASGLGGLSSSGADHSPTLGGMVDVSSLPTNSTSTPNGGEEEDPILVSGRDVGVTPSEAAALCPLDSLLATLSDAAQWEAMAGGTIGADNCWLGGATSPEAVAGGGGVMEANTFRWPASTATATSRVAGDAFSIESSPQNGYFIPWNASEMQTHVQSTGIKRFLRTKTIVTGPTSFTSSYGGDGAVNSAIAAANSGQRSSYVLPGAGTNRLRCFFCIRYKCSIKADCQKTNAILESIRSSSSNAAAATPARYPMAVAAANGDYPKCSCTVLSGSDEFTIVEVRNFSAAAAPAVVAQTFPAAVALACRSLRTAGGGSEAFGAGRDRTKYYFSSATATAAPAEASLAILRSPDHLLLLSALQRNMTPSSSSSSSHPPPLLLGYDNLKTLSSISCSTSAPITGGGAAAVDEFRVGSGRWAGRVFSSASTSLLATAPESGPFGSPMQLLRSPILRPFVGEWGITSYGGGTSFSQVEPITSNSFVVLVAEGSEGESGSGVYASPSSARRSGGGGDLLLRNLSLLATAASAPFAVCARHRCNPIDDCSGGRGTIVAARDRSLYPNASAPAASLLFSPNPLVDPSAESYFDMSSSSSSSSSPREWPAGGRVVTYWPNCVCKCFSPFYGKRCESSFESAPVNRSRLDGEGSNESSDESNSSNITGGVGGGGSSSSSGSGGGNIGVGSEPFGELFTRFEVTKGLPVTYDEARRLCAAEPAKPSSAASTSTPPYSRPIPSDVAAAAGPSFLASVRGRAQWASLFSSPTRLATPFSDLLDAGTVIGTSYEECWVGGGVGSSSGAAINSREDSAANNWRWDALVQNGNININNINASRWAGMLFTNSSSGGGSATPPSLAPPFFVGWNTTDFILNANQDPSTFDGLERRLKVSATRVLNVFPQAQSGSSAAFFNVSNSIWWDPYGVGFGGGWPESSLASGVRDWAAAAQQLPPDVFTSLAHTDLQHWPNPFSPGGGMPSSLAPDSGAIGGVGPNPRSAIDGSSLLWCYYCARHVGCSLEEDCPPGAVAVEGAYGDCRCSFAPPEKGDRTLTVSSPKSLSYSASVSVGAEPTITAFDVKGGTATVTASLVEAETPPTTLVLPTTVAATTTVTTTAAPRPTGPPTTPPPVPIPPRRPTLSDVGYGYRYVIYTPSTDDDLLTSYPSTSSSSSSSLLFSDLNLLFSPAFNGGLKKNASTAAGGGGGNGSASTSSNANASSSGGYDETSILFAKRFLIPSRAVRGSGGGAASGGVLRFGVLVDGIGGGAAAAATMADRQQQQQYASQRGFSIVAGSDGGFASALMAATSAGFGARLAVSKLSAVADWFTLRSSFAAPTIAGGPSSTPSPDVFSSSLSTAASFVSIANRTVRMAPVAGADSYYAGGSGGSASSAIYGMTDAVGWPGARRVAVGCGDLLTIGEASWLGGVNSTTTVATSASSSSSDAAAPPPILYHYPLSHLAPPPTASLVVSYGRQSQAPSASLCRSGGALRYGGIVYSDAPFASSKPELFYIHFLPLNASTSAGASLSSSPPLALNVTAAVLEFSKTVWGQVGSGSAVPGEAGWGGPTPPPNAGGGGSAPSNMCPLPPFFAVAVEARDGVLVGNPFDPSSYPPTPAAFAPMLLLRPHHTLADHNSGSGSGALSAPPPAILLSNSTHSAVACTIADQTAFSAMVVPINATIEAAAERMRAQMLRRRAARRSVF